MLTKKSPKVLITEAIPLILLFVLFVVVTYLSQTYSEYLKGVIGIGGYESMLIYIFINIMAVVAAPVTTLPLMPLATAIWGSNITALLSALSWTIGSVMAFWLSKYYGRPIVKRFINLKKVDRMSKVITGRNPFWTIVMLRIIVPVDVLSYALGLIIKIPTYKYALATFIGVLPFAFIFAYTAALPVLYQVLVLAFTTMLIVLFYKRLQKLYLLR